MHTSLAKPAKNAIPLHAVTAGQARVFLARQKRGGLATATGFTGAAGQLAALPDAKGGIAAWVLGLGEGKDQFAIAAAAEKLPAGTYKLGEVPAMQAGANAALAWLMGGYHFGRYKKNDKKPVKLVAPPGVDAGEVTRIAQNLFLARDLINTPANDMGPAELEAAARDLAEQHGAKVRVVSGAALTRDYPLIAAVGQGSEGAPRLIEIVWG